MNDVSQIVLAFSPYQVVRLTGLSHWQLAYWDRTGFFSPEHASGAPGVPYGRIYSFRDVVALRTLSILRNKHGVSLPHLRQVAEKLVSYSKTPWSEIQLKVWNRKVVFVEPETGKALEVVAGQYVLLPIIEVEADVTKDIEAMKRRRPDQIGKTEQHRYVSHNSRVVAGTRVPVATVLQFLEDGYSAAEIIREYPSLTEADIIAVQHLKADTAA